ncbi:MAG: Fpg/Nei family DNA glycosylase [Cellulomonadaceae bacterium]
MPEGHTVHRLARTFTRLFAGQLVAASSPQGRFAAGARLIHGARLVEAQAVGKQLFLGFAPGTLPPDGDLMWLRVHLGLYGAWTFAGEGAAVHAIGAPRRRVGEREVTDPAAPPAASASTRDGSDGAHATPFAPPAPRGQVRLRLLGEHAVADLTGPTACEVLTPAQKADVLARLGPDPLRPDADPERFVAAVRRSRTPVGVQLMNQAVIAGVGNIYRAESLFRARLDPATPGTQVPREVLRALWDDLVATMSDGVRTGAIVTTRPQDRGFGHERGHMDRRRVRQNADGDPGAVPGDEAFYVYHRDGLACRVCGAPVLVREVAGRTLFWCARCQG